MTGVALDTNLLLLLIVGSAVGDVVGKRLKSYTPEDWGILRDYLERSDRLIATPNVWTEVSNICTFGVRGDWHKRIQEALILTIHGTVEIVRGSRDVTTDPEFPRLGLVDCEWLSVLEEEADTELMTDDLALYNIALSRGFKAVNFTHLRNFD